MSETEVAPSAPPAMPSGVTETAPRADLARPILVCGVGRSGTSLLQSMLAAHPAVALPPETHFFRRYVAAGGTRRRLEALPVDYVRRELEADTDLARAGVPASVLLEAESDGCVDLVRIYTTVLREWAARDAKPRVGDKDPRNLDFLESLGLAFPKALVLHIVRDPRAVVASRMKAAWSASRPWWSHAVIAEEQLRRGRAVGRRVFGDRYLELRYEDLLHDPEGTLRRVAAHVEIPFASEMLAFGDSARRLVSPEEESWKRETFGPLLEANAEKWRSELDPRQVTFVEAVCREAFDALGYERSHPRRLASQAAAAALRPIARAAFALRRVRETRS